MKNVYVITAILHSSAYLPVRELKKFRQSPRLSITVIPKLATTFESLLERLESLKGERIMLVTNFPPDSYLQKEKIKDKRKRRGDYLSRTMQNDSYARSRAFFRKVLTDYQIEAVHFVSRAPAREIETGELKQYIKGEDMTLNRGGFSTKPDETAKTFADGLVEKVQESILKMYEREIQAGEDFLENNIYCGLKDLNTGFDVDGIRYFSENDFKILLDRVRESGLGVYGIEPWKDGRYFDVAVCEEYNNDPADPDWYMTAFEKFRQTGEPLQYAASYHIPPELLKQ